MLSLLYRVARLASCWCTEPKYWKNIPPTICLRCSTIKEFEIVYPEIAKSTVDAPTIDAG
jgi:hypothetical protein